MMSEFTDDDQGIVVDGSYIDGDDLIDLGFGSESDEEQIWDELDSFYEELSTLRWKELVQYCKLATMLGCIVAILVLIGQGALWVALVIVKYHCFKTLIKVLDSSTRILKKDT
jgi:hypothetical protein